MAHVRTANLLLLYRSNKDLKLLLAHSTRKSFVTNFNHNIVLVCIELL